MDAEWSLLLRFGEICKRVDCRVIMAAKKDTHETYDILFEYLNPTQEWSDFVDRIINVIPK